MVLNGWSGGGRHFIATMAVFDGPTVSQPKERNPNYDDSIQCLTHRFVLLVFCPLGDEEDLGVQSQALGIVLFMIGDNCSVNQAIGRKLGALPFIGCASHRL